MQAFIRVREYSKPATKPVGGAPAKPVPSNKFLICHPFWDGDKGHSNRLVRLLADLEPQKSELADLLFVPRFDSSADDEVVKHASKKFTTFVHKSTKRATGWPGGCNAIFFSAVEWIYQQMGAGNIPHYAVVLNLAADTVPMVTNWLRALHQIWHDENRKRQIYVAGAYIPEGPHGHEHINGDAILLSGEFEFLRWLSVRAGEVVNKAGWDWVLAKEFKRRGWVDIPSIRSGWRQDGFSEFEWEQEERFGTILYHGVKSFDLLEMARKKLL